MPPAGQGLRKFVGGNSQWQVTIQYSHISSCAVFKYFIQVTGEVLSISMLESVQKIIQLEQSLIDSLLAFRNSF